jgi:putative hydrolase of the HAD superfamily
LSLPDRVGWSRASTKSAIIAAAMTPLPLSPTDPAHVDFSAVENWIFDLDNTLYPRRSNLFAQVDIRITHYVMAVTKLDFEPARVLQKSYYRDYGTTLNGLMRQHAVDPEHFLKTVHDIDYSPVEAHPALAAAIAGLPGRKFILTNGDVPHARAVLARLGIEPTLFEVIHDVKAMNYRPKPERSAYDGLLTDHAIDPSTAAMFDDLDKNLVIPHELGMETVHVIAGEDFAHAQVEAWELEPAMGVHVHHRTDDLAAFLAALK